MLKERFVPTSPPFVLRRRHKGSITIPAEREDMSSSRCLYSHSVRKPKRHSLRSDTLLVNEDHNLLQPNNSPIRYSTPEWIHDPPKERRGAPTTPPFLLFLKADRISDFHLPPAHIPFKSSRQQHLHGLGIGFGGNVLVRSRPHHDLIPERRGRSLLRKNQDDSTSEEMTVLEFLKDEAAPIQVNDYYPLHEYSRFETNPQSHSSEILAFF